MADRRERANDMATSFRAALEGFQSELWTTMPGIIQTYDPVRRMCSVQPAIQAAIVNQDTGEKEWINMPILVDCPVVFPGGGGYVLAFPILPGDEVLISIANRCIDGWWDLGGVQPQLDVRMHDLSDGFVIPGIESKLMVTPALSPTDVQLRSKDGLTMLSVGPLGVTLTSPMPVNITSLSTINLIAPLILANGVPIP